MTNKYNKLFILASVLQIIKILTILVIVALLLHFLWKSFSNYKEGLTGCIMPPDNESNGNCSNIIKASNGTCYKKCHKICGTSYSDENIEDTCKYDDQCDTYYLIVPCSKQTSISEPDILGPFTMQSGNKYLNIGEKHHNTSYKLTTEKNSPYTEIYIQYHSTVGKDKLYFVYAKMPDTNNKIALYGWPSANDHLGLFNLNVNDTKQFLVKIINTSNSNSSNFTGDGKYKLQMDFVTNNNYIQGTLYRNIMLQMGLNNNVWSIKSINKKTSDENIFHPSSVQNTSHSSKVIDYSDSIDDYRPMASEESKINAPLKCNSI